MCLIVRPIRADEVIFNIDVTRLGLWRGDESDHFAWPKWGIYRFILDRSNLRVNEEDMRIANLSVTEVMPVD